MAKPVLHFIEFKDLDKWFVSYYVNPYKMESKYALHKLSEVIFPAKHLIKKLDYDGSIPVVEKISFSEGKIYLREENKTGMNLYKLAKGNLLISKINFHQGAIAINNSFDMVCSTHYQPYKLSLDKIFPDYLTMILRAKPFLRFVDYLRAEGIKNEATYEFIGNLKIPLPSLEIQKKLVSEYKRKTELAREQEGEAEELTKQIDDYLIKELGVNLPNKIIKDIRLRFINFSDITRWDFAYNNYLQQGFINFKSKHPTKKLRNILKSYQYGTSNKANNLKGVPVLRMNNIQNGKLNISDLKFINTLSNEEINALKLDAGDILFNRTNSKELVGKTCVFDLKDDFIFASYLIRLKVEKDVANPHYINLLFNSPIVRNQIDATSRQITGQANVNVEELQNFNIPLPPLEIQNKIVEKISAIKEQIKSLKTQAEQNRKQARENFEREIFNG